MAVTTKIERKRFDQPDETREFTDGKGKMDVVTIGGHDIGRGRFEPGWRWSAHVKPIANTDSCQADQVAEQPRLIPEGTEQLRFARARLAGRW